MKRLRIALALLACTGCAHTAAPAQPPPPAPQPPAQASLSDGASKIVAALRLRPDIDRICGGGEEFRDAMRGVVMNLVIAGEIEGNPRNDAESAADFLHAHCVQPKPTQASAAAPGASTGSR